MLAEFYHPNSTAGAHRPVKLAKYLPRFGWSPTVLCAEWTAGNCGGTYDPSLEGKDSCPTHRVPHPAPPSTIPARILGRIRREFSPQLYPKSFARVLLREAMGLCQRERFEVLWATFSPGSTLEAASAVREFRPKIVYPYHYRGSDVEKFKNLVGVDVGVEVRLHDWYK